MFYTVKTQFYALFTQFYASFHHWIHISRVQYPSTADILVMENTVSLYTSKYCTTWMCSVEELIYNDQTLFQFHSSKQNFSVITHKWHTAVLMWPSYFIYQHKYQQTYTIMRCIDTGKLSEIGIRNGSVMPVWCPWLLVPVFFCRANMMNIATTTA